MTTAATYLPPLLTLVGLSYFVALIVLVTRAADLIKGRRPISYYEEFDGVGASTEVMRSTRQLANLFEFPVLFYVASGIIIALGLTDTILAKLCWAYVILRWLHAASHVFLNRLWLRTPIFISGNFVLLCIWIELSLDVLT